MAERIYLIGFMGAGKTTVGELLAEKLGWSFVDLDDEIERVEGKSVPDIFRDAGEPHFRRIESEQLRAVSGSVGRVVALGGGAYADPENRSYVEGTGVSVYLEAKLESIEDRIEDDGVRPLFSDSNGIAELYQRRLPSYRMAAVRVETDDLAPTDIADDILRIVNSL